ncbi:hypothetical protein [Bacillus phage vB_BanS-Thrax5]|nr:hypothetical protein [Bacillus phage vB_BanS-Thrax5]
MKEIITDELIEQFAKKYEEYVDVTSLFGGEIMFTFEQFVAITLEERKVKIRKALEHIEEQKKA